MKINSAYIFIPGNVPSSKNSKRIVMRGKIPKLLWSKLAMKYKEDSAIHFKKKREQFLMLTANMEKPYLIGFHFIRDSKRKFDHVGPLETIQDLMVHHKWIDDDNAFEMIPAPLYINKSKYKYFSLNRKKPGVIIRPMWTV